MNDSYVKLITGTILIMVTFFVLGTHPDKWYETYPKINDTVIFISDNENTAISFRDDIVDFKYEIITCNIPSLYNGSSCTLVEE